MAIDLSSFRPSQRIGAPSFDTFKPLGTALSENLDLARQGAQLTAQSEIGRIMGEAKQPQYLEGLNGVQIENPLWKNEQRQIAHRIYGIGMKMGDPEMISQAKTMLGLLEDQAQPQRSRDYQAISQALANSREIRANLDSLQGELRPLYTDIQKAVLSGQKPSEELSQKVKDLESQYSSKIAELSPFEADAVEAGATGDQLKAFDYKSAYDIMSKATGEATGVVRSQLGLKMAETQLKTAQTEQGMLPQKQKLLGLQIQGEKQSQELEKEKAKRDKQSFAIDFQDKLNGSLDKQDDRVRKALNDNKLAPPEFYDGVISTVRSSVQSQNYFGLIKSLSQIIEPGLSVNEGEVSGYSSGGQAGVMRWMKDKLGVADADYSKIQKYAVELANSKKAMARKIIAQKGDIYGTRSGSQPQKSATPKAGGAPKAPRASKKGRES